MANASDQTSIPSSLLSPEECHRSFIASRRPHILQITNHGIHDWMVTPGLPDTGGQNLFVNQMTESLAGLGYRITIANRGGYPHPLTGRCRRGLEYRDAQCRILMLEDGLPRFIRKEEMYAQVPELADFLLKFLSREKAWPDLIVSHYWDAAAIGATLNRHLHDSREHFWIPHSLGAVKKRNMDPSTWNDLHLEERIEIERDLLEDLDGVAATSNTIRKSLFEDYGCATDLFLPPCVETDRFHPRKLADDDPIWTFLADHSALSAAELRRSRIVTEISRTDRTKRKDLLIRAFAATLREVEDAVLVLTVDPDAQPLSGELERLAESLNVRHRIIRLGFIRERLPSLYAVSQVYCSPSVMEGFGMSVQEAAATGVPAVTSDLVPFAVEYLLGDEVRVVEGTERKPRIREGAGAIVVEANDTDAFARALVRILRDDDLRRRMGAAARNITIPHFTWDQMMAKFTAAAGFDPDRLGC
jgi:mannosylfructose-phosphate synthase